MCGACSMWNEFNKVVQCHNCGQVWEPRNLFKTAAWNEKRVIQNLLGLAEGDDLVQEIRRIIGE